MARIKEGSVIMKTTGDEIIATINDVPTRTSELENNSGFLISVTKSDLGLDNVDNVKQATKTEHEALDTKVTSHLADEANPHSTNKTHVGLSNVDNVKQATKAEFDEHLADEANPHSTNKTHIGLSNVDNVKQATKAEFDEHLADEANPHSTNKTHVGLSNVDNVKQMPISGGTFTGISKAQNNISHAVAQMRNIILSTEDADVNAMNEGEIWIKYG